MSKLIEIFRKHASGGDDNLMDFEDFEQAIADYEKSKWVSVDERLPEVGSRCLTLESDGTIEICKYRSSYHSYPIKNAVCFEDEQDEQPSQVYATHWQPLPTTPNP